MDLDSIHLFAPTVAAIVSLVIAVVLLFASACISASEVAFFSLSPRDLDKLDEDENHRDGLIQDLLEKQENLMAAILIGNNFVNVAIIMLFSYFFAQVMPVSDNPAWLIFLSQTIILTFLLLLFGEILPKVYASHHALSFSRTVSPVMKILTSIFHPFILLLVKSMGGLNRHLADKMTDDVTMDDLSDALKVTTQVHTDEKKMLEGIIEFGDKTVKDAMTTRSEMVTIDVDTPFSKVLSMVVDQKYSRMPVIEDTEDHIKGILYIKDLLPYLNRDDKFEWQSLIREPYYVPENKPIDDLLDDFRQKRLHMAIVVDEFGGTSGLITMEDVLEEIVGEIHDEYDEDVQTWQKVGQKEWIFEARTSITDFCKVTGLDQDDDLGDKADNCESIGGLLLEIKQNFPRTHEVIRFRGIEFTILSMDKRRIDRVRIKLP
ncbi:MAG: gliding motility-associated protein GldE [Bacteroidales bacterium]|jgi:gliding motility-associated protein GldE|nr:gliding motility-associated protein GldE [Bacteroidales bacterium]